MSLVLTNVATIEEFLGDRGANYVVAVRFNEFSKILLLEVPRDRVRETAGRGFTSKRQLGYLTRVLEEKFDLRVLTTFRDSQQFTDLESGLRAMLIRKFAGLVEDTYISFPTANKALVWIGLAQVLEKSVADGVQAVVSSFLKQAEISCEGIEFLNPRHPEPSIVVILRSVKVRAPASIREIMEDLSGKGLSCPSERWLAAKLDGARKRGLLVRNATETYVLTALGLDIVPHSRSRASSDIDRMLSIAKRRGW